MPRRADGERGGRGSLLDLFGWGLGVDPLGSELGAPLPVGWVDEGDALSAEVAIPPALADDVDVTLDGRTICVRAARRRSASRPLPRGGIAVQSAWGAFERRITAPRGVDLGAASATLEQGRMRIRLPKRPASAPRSIPIRTAA